MSQPLLVCPNCSEPFGDGNCYTCDICGRLIGGCQKCAWFGFTDTTDTPQQCDRPNCYQLGNGSSGEDSIHNPLDESMARIARVQREMKERSGSFYELAKERSRVIQAAWRAAGRPRHVSQVITPNGVAYGVKNRNGYFDWVTEADWDAWIAWQRERSRLHTQHGWDTPPARRYGKLTDDDN